MVKEILHILKTYFITFQYFKNNNYNDLFIFIFIFSLIFILFNLYLFLMGCILY